MTLLSSLMRIVSGGLSSAPRDELVLFFERPNDAVFEYLARTVDRGIQDGATPADKKAAALLFPNYAEALVAHSFTDPRARELGVKYVSENSGFRVTNALSLSERVELLELAEKSRSTNDLAAVEIVAMSRSELKQSIQPFDYAAAELHESLPILGVLKARTMKALDAVLKAPAFSESASTKRANSASGDGLDIKDLIALAAAMIQNRSEAPARLIPLVRAVVYSVENSVSLQIAASPDYHPSHGSEWPTPWAEILGNTNP